MVRCSGSARYARRCRRWGSRLNQHGEYWCHDHAGQEAALGAALRELVPLRLDTIDWRVRDET